MADRPIPFSDPMVAALLAGRKTQTRRILDPQPVLTSTTHAAMGIPVYANDFSWPTKHGSIVSCKPHPPEVYLRDFPLRYAVDDRLYVRETYYQFGHWGSVFGGKTKGGKQKWAFIPTDPGIVFQMPEGCRLGRHHRDPYTPAWHKRLGRFMPRAASRLTLIVEGVKVERLQDISRDDAMAEGIVQTWGDFGGSPPECFVVENARYGDASGTHIYDNHTSIQNFSILWNSINGPGSWDANPWCAAIGFSVVRANIDSLPPAPEVER